MSKYDFKAIEKKWQAYWQQEKTFAASLDPSKPKYYILDMFPYPSGAGLHVGHVTGYTATDVLARYKRLKGFNVLHPMGWDSFGLPAEQYAMRTGTHPKITTEKNIATYKRQLQALGFSYDWSREFSTTDPDYYRWTQWIFLKLYEKGLAYESEALVNYCPALGTVLSNEEVEEGRTKEGCYPVERRPLKQWMLKITVYAERLLEDLEELDWPDSLKRLQKNWIGKSEGTKVIFPFQYPLETFTTRADTLYGVTFLVLAPEHPLVKEITIDAERRQVEAYIKETMAKSDLARTELNKEKTGVFTGAFARHPLTDRPIPLWVADYVLMGYGTGVVMGVPSHCERDFDFAKKYGLEVLPVIDPTLRPDAIPVELSAQDFRLEVLQGRRCWEGEGTLIHSGPLDGLTTGAAKVKATELLQKKKLGHKAITYKLRDWLFSRQRYWGEPIPILHFTDGSQRALEEDELPLTLPELDRFEPVGDGKSPLAQAKTWIEIKDPKTGKKAFRELNVMPQWAGSCWYYLRFLDPKNDNALVDPQAENYWMPVDLYVGGIEHAVLHLLYARFWHKVLYDIGVVHTKEPFQALRNQGLVIAYAYKVPGGGYVPSEEVKETKAGKWIHMPTKQEVIQSVDKMSKSKLNGVSPDAIIEQYGADTLRLYEMFMAPFEKEKLWNFSAISGCHRFLQRFWDLIHSEKVMEAETTEGMRLAHICVHAVEREIENLSFNTAIAKMMEFINAFTLLEQYPKQALLLVTLALSPFAPHIAEECFEILTGKKGIAYETYPQADGQYLTQATATYVAQVNGKVRARWQLPKDLTQEALLNIAKKEPNVQRFLGGTIEKVIYVPNKLINIVVK